MLLAVDHIIIPDLCVYIRSKRSFDLLLINLELCFIIDLLFQRDLPFQGRTDIFIHTGISDHSLVFAIRKISVVTKQENTLEIRNMKDFDEGKFIEDMLKQHWEYYFFADDPNAIWEIGKILFLEVLDKHGNMHHFSKRR